MRAVVVFSTTGTAELLIKQLILMLFKVLYFDVLKYTFSHFQADDAYHYFSPSKPSGTRSECTNNSGSASFKVKVENQRPFKDSPMLNFFALVSKI